MRASKRDIERLLKWLGIKINVKDYNIEIHQWRQPYPSGRFSTEIRVEFDSDGSHWMWQIFAVGKYTDDGDLLWDYDFTIADMTIE